MPDEPMPDAVVLHGLGGTPATVDPLVEALREAGWSVDAPTLPGHASTSDDLLHVTWAHWIDAVPPARVVIGQSLGGSLALAAASLGRARTGAVCINALGYSDPDALDVLEAELASGVEWVDAGPSDIRAAGVVEVAYDRLPLTSLIEMTRGLATIDLAAVTVPVLVVTSGDDGVVDPYHSDVIASSVRGDVDRLRLPRSGHVATLDVDAPVLIDATVAWVSRALSRPR